MQPVPSHGWYSIENGEGKLQGEIQMNTINKNVSYKPSRLLGKNMAVLTGVVMGCAVSSAMAAPQVISGTILADNGALAVLESSPGSFSVITTSVSTSWPNLKRFEKTIDDDPQALKGCRIHVIAWGDGGVAQGLLASIQGSGGEVYTGQPGGPFQTTLSTITYSVNTAAALAFANNNANAAQIIQNAGASANGFVSAPAVTGGLSGTWGPVNLPPSPGRNDVRFIWDSKIDNLNANPNNYRFISTPCASVVRPVPKRPIAHIASWEIAGQFNPDNAIAPNLPSIFEVWTYGYTVNSNCSGPVVPFTSSISGTPIAGRWVHALQRGPSADASNLPQIGKTLGATLLTPVKFSPGGLTMHPGPNQECAVVRFTAPQSGKYRLMGRFWGQNVSSSGTETDVSVVHTNGANIVIGSIASGTVRGLAPTPSNLPFATAPTAPLTMQQGETIDFRVGSHGSFLNDSTGLHGYIQRDEL